ncbi:hypothetical protein ACFRNT_14360 [Streptomyces sp. NPDC056697]|uniref:hypothetical protein n=1 Tax=Streptomyces sp. NPDC056697 TaxID=3345915 RepID=UPI00367D386E
MIVFFLLIVPTAAALLVILGGASLVQVLGPVALLALIAVVAAWATDSRGRRPLPRIAQKPGVPPLPPERMRPWHHNLPPAARQRTRDITHTPDSDSGESHGHESDHAA